LLPIMAGQPIIQPINFAATFSAYDINFDGYLDFSVLAEHGAKYGQSSIWVYDPGSGLFVQNELTQQLRGWAGWLGFDPKKHEIIVSINRALYMYLADPGGSCPAAYRALEGDRYRVENNRLILTHKEDIAQDQSALGPAPRSIAADRAGNVFFADQDTILRLDPTTGILSLVAGSGPTRFAGGNGPAAGAQLRSPAGLAVDAAGNLYVADAGNNRIRKVSNGAITTVTGIGTAGFSGDNGPATNAQLNGPDGIAVDSAGDLYIADAGNHRIRKVSYGVITTVAGNGTRGDNADYGDNGPATSAQVKFPIGVAVDAAGNLYIAQTPGVIVRDASGKLADKDDAIGRSGLLRDYRIRKVSKGVITTVAGGGSQVGDGGPATSAQLDQPSAVAVDSAGNLYIVEWNRIRKVSNGAITTVAGNGIPGFSGDNGPATNAQLQYPNGIAVDAAGNLYVADAGNNRIRKFSNGVITTVAAADQPYCTVTVSDLIGGTMRVTDVRRFDDKGQPVK
jgi:sugar lactone lactonase YvrE